MKHILALALASLLALLASCSKAGSDVAGTYQLDTTAIEAAMKTEMEKEMASMSAEERTMAEGFLSTMVEAMAGSEFKLNPDNTWESKFTMAGSDTVEKGTWELKGDKITFTTTEPERGPDADKNVATFEDGTISMTMDTGDKPMTLILRKK